MNLFNSIGYDQCSECKRLIPAYSPYAQASACPPLYTYIENNKVCWQCVEKRTSVLGVVPYRDQENRNNHQTGGLNKNAKPLSHKKALDR